MKKLILVFLFITYSSLSIGDEMKFECNVNGSSFERDKNINNSKPREKKISGSVILNLKLTSHTYIQTLDIEVNTFDFSFFMSSQLPDTKNLSDSSTFYLSRNLKSKQQGQLGDNETIESVKLDRVSGELSYYTNSSSNFNSDYYTKKYSGLCKKINLQNKF